MADENELMLELSIGGIFAKPNRNVTDSIEKDKQIDRSKDGGNIQANRRRNREEKVKKTVEYGSCGSVSGPFVENKEWLEAQIVGQKDEPACKKENIGNMQEKFGSVLTASTRRSFRPCLGNKINMKPNEYEIDGGCGRWYCKIKLDGLYSDGHCSSHQGGSSNDSGSNSSNSQLDHQPASTSTTSVEPSDQHQATGSIKQTLSTTDLKYLTAKPNEPQSNLHESSFSNKPSKPEPNSQHQQAALLARMPCVSTTGNGPNGKTVSGFLYRYTIKEVSIVCVCHGRSFSPAGFVEHAGGVDVANPLKNITIYPAAFAS